MKACLILGMCGAALAAAVTTARADSVGDAVVYIQCDAPGKPQIRGTGVIVSEKGHVLTAKHVAPQGYACEAALGNASMPLRGLTRDSAEAKVDAMLLRLTPRNDEQFSWLRWCRLDDALKGRKVVATGFPVAKTPEPSVREGVLSTVMPDEHGIVESDVLTASGMSGGPVTLQGGSSLVGIVAGATFDSATGAPASFGVLAAEAFANAFGSILTAAPTCEANGGPGVVDSFFEGEDISNLAKFGESVESVRKSFSELTGVVVKLEVSKANEFKREPTRYFEVAWNPPRTTKPDEAKCSSNGKVVFFFRNGKLFRVSLRSWYSPQCKHYDGYFQYAAEGLGARIKAERFGKTGVVLAKMFVEKGKKVVMSGWMDKRISVIDIAEAGNDDFMSDDWVDFIDHMLRDPW